MGATRLFYAGSIEEQWRAVAGPWLREQAGAAWKDARPTVVLTPSRAESFYLRSRLIGEGGSFLGLRFWTPSDARKFLGDALTVKTTSATRAEQRLLARACAERLLQEAPTMDRPVLAGVAQEPGAFLRAYDLLLGAGWEPARDGAGYGRRLAEEMRRELIQRRLSTQAGFHRGLLREATASTTPCIPHLLVIGFNAAHWPLWDLLRATVACAEHATVAFSKPRVFGEDVDQLWISSWEQALGTSVEEPESVDEEEPPMPFAGLVASYEREEATESEKADLTFLVAPELASHVQAVVLQALAYLSRESCTRLGIIFAEANALALGVAEELRRQGVPLNDGTGFMQPGVFEKRFWHAWIDLQEEPSVQNLIQWVRACDAQGISCGLESVALSEREFAVLVDKALSESLVDDLYFLALQLREISGGRGAAAADFLQRRIALPETATFSQFFAATREVMASLGWQEQLDRLSSRPPAGLGENDLALSRRAYLHWLREASDSQERTRGTEGNHFYGKVHLLIYAQMTGQTWSHLILTGLNEGVWPRLNEAGAFGSRHELAELNRHARELNRLGTEQGAQGAGHESVRVDRGHCLLPLEQQDLALRDLCAALDSTTDAVCLTAVATEAGRGLLPSDFFNHAFHSRTGEILDEKALKRLEFSTEAWCGRHQALLVSASSPTPATEDVAATRIAFEARRNPSQPFGPYEFAFREAPAQPIQLSCKIWETAWNHPATVWLQEVVGVEPWPEGTMNWPQAVGTWIHRWLGTALRTCAEHTSARDFLLSLHQAAEDESTRVHQRSRSAGVKLYPWWNPVWAQARAITLGLGESLAPHLGNRQILSELRLPRSLMVALPGSDAADFELRGRIDLLLVERGAVACDPAEGDFTDCTCWVIDFKTGTAQSLNDKRLREGHGLQAVLYAMAVRAGGAGPVSLSLHTRETLLKPQIDLDAVMKIDPLFRSLQKLHREGIFGMRPDGESEYGFSPAYPMATRFVPRDILEAKWVLVHGAESGAKENAE